MSNRTMQEPVTPEHATHEIRVLAVGADPAPFRDFGRFARVEGAKFDRAPDPDEALRALRRGDCDLLLLPLGVEQTGNLEQWAEWLHDIPHPPRVVALSRSPSLALRTTPIARLEVLPFPVRHEQVSDLLRRIRAVEGERVLELPEETESPADSGDLISRSPEMLPVFRAIAQAAQTDAPVLIVGESGTGKELVARTIHQRNQRAGAPFVSLHCGAVPDDLLEIELFGHEEGAVAGAAAQKPGRMERAAGGTLFLDEIGDMSLRVQAKLLQAMEEREIERVGGAESIPVDVRLIAALNREPGGLVHDGRLREDLYFRLAVVTIRLPRLVERGDDLFLLTGHYLRELGRQYGKTFTGISEQAWQLLQSQDWPGNVRELRNTIERAVLVADEPVLRAENLPEEWSSRRDAIAPATGVPATLREVEAAHIRAVLARSNGQIGEAARILGVHRNTLSRKLRLYGL